MEDARSHQHRTFPKLFLSSLLIKAIFITCFIKYGSANNSTKTVIKYLPNENCKPRETLIHIDRVHNLYYPMVVKLHQCGGSCYNHAPSVKKCVAAKQKIIGIKVRRMLNGESHTIYLQNHTSCSCPCTSDETSCRTDTQIWDNQYCRCECKPGASSRKSQCYRPFEYEASTCSCRCKLRCRNNQIIDEKNCRCLCKPETYQQCIRLNRHFNLDTCRCMTFGERSTGKTECDGLSNKWAAVLILTGFLVFVALTFDCILYAKKTGIAFKLRACCRGNSNATKDNGHCTPLRLKDQEG